MPWPAQRSSPPRAVLMGRLRLYRTCAATSRFVPSKARAPARSRTSCTSFRKTAASITCSRAIPAPTPFPRGRPPTERRSNSCRRASPLTTSSIIRFNPWLRRATVPASFREPTAAWTASTKSPPAVTREVSNIRSTSTCRILSRSRTSTWRTNGCWPTICFSRSSMKVSSGISTSLPRRRTPA